MLCSGLHENLKMIVAIPLLWGVPPEHEALRCDVLCLHGLEGDDSSPGACFQNVLDCQPCKLPSECLKLTLVEFSATA